MVSLTCPASPSRRHYWQIETLPNAASQANTAKAAQYDGQCRHCGTTRTFGGFFEDNGLRHHTGTMAHMQVPREEWPAYTGRRAIKR